MGCCAAAAAAKGSKYGGRKGMEMQGE